MGLAMNREEEQLERLKQKKDNRKVCPEQNTQIWIYV